MLQTLLTLPSPPSPVVFEAGPFALRYYGLFIALGIVVGTWLTSKELQRRGYDGALAMDALFFTIPPGFVGARIYHVITDYDLYTDDWTGIFAVWNGGLGIYGAVIGGFLGLLVFSYFREIGPFAFADAAAAGRSSQKTNGPPRTSATRLTVTAERIINIYP